MDYTLKSETQSFEVSTKVIGNHVFNFIRCTGFKLPLFAVNVSKLAIWIRVGKFIISAYPRPTA